MNREQIKLTCRCSAMNKPLVCKGNCAYICQRLEPKPRLVFDKIDQATFVEDE